MPINMVQDFSVEVDSFPLFERYIRLAMETVLNSTEEIAVKVIDRSTPHVELHVPGSLNIKKDFPVILISGWYLPKAGEKEHSYFDGYKPWQTFRFDGDASPIAMVMEHISKLIYKNWTTWREEFFERFGDGYSKEFNQFDGLIEVGYKVQSCHCFPEQLAICLDHMYYGK